MSKINKVSVYLFFSLTFPFLFFFTSSCQKFPKKDQDSILFQISEDELFQVDRSKMPSSLSGENCILFGDLFDTGELNLLDVYTFDGKNAFQRKYYVKNRIFTNPFKSIWAKVTGEYTRLNYDPDNKNEIEIIDFKILPEINEKIEAVRRYCCYWVKVNKDHFDLNKFKNTQRFRNALFDLNHLDINKTEFEENDTLVFFDYDKMIIGIDCGKHTLRENDQRGDFLNYLAIYDLGNKELLKVKIVNTGYFLE